MLRGRVLAAASPELVAQLAVHLKKHRTSLPSAGLFLLEALQGLPQGRSFFFAARAHEAYIIISFGFTAPGLCTRPSSQATAQWKQTTTALTMQKASQKDSGYRQLSRRRRFADLAAAAMSKLWPAACNCSLLSRQCLICEEHVICPCAEVKGTLGVPESGFLAARPRGDIVVLESHAVSAGKFLTCARWTICTC